ncbi:MAG: hypothetical protein KF713_09385 [Turneriella sp.]|nr:hypothetical protein [Turneriella sp.]
MRSRIPIHILFSALILNLPLKAELAEEYTQPPVVHWSLGIGGFNPSGGLSSSFLLPNLRDFYIEALLNWGVYGFLEQDEKSPRQISILGGGSLPVKGGAINARIGFGWKLSEERQIDSFFWTKGISGVTYAGNTTITTYYGNWFSAPTLKSTILMLDLMYEPSGSEAYIQRQTVSESSPGCSNYCYYSYEYTIAYRPQNSLYLRPKIRWQTFYDFVYEMDGNRRHFRSFYYFELGPIVAPNLKQYGFWLEFGSLGGFTTRLGLGWIFRKDFPELPAENSYSIGTSYYSFGRGSSVMHEHYFPFLFTLEYGVEVK